MSDLCYKTRHYKNEDNLQTISTNTTDLNQLCIPYIQIVSYQIYFFKNLINKDSFHAKIKIQTQFCAYCRLRVAPYTEAALVRRVDYQIFRDFAENKGRFSVGAANVEVRDVLRSVIFTGSLNRRLLTVIARI